MRRRKSLPTPLLVALIVAGGLLVAGGVALAVYVSARGARVLADEASVIDTGAELRRHANRDVVKVRGKVAFAVGAPQANAQQPDTVTRGGTLTLSDGTQVPFTLSPMRRDELEAWDRARRPSAPVVLSGGYADGPQLYDCRIIDGR